MAEEYQRSGTGEAIVRDTSPAAGTSPCRWRETSYPRIRDAAQQTNPMLSPGPITRKEREDGRNAAAVSRDGRPSRLHGENSERRGASELRGPAHSGGSEIAVEKSTDMPIAPMITIL